jgi:predicted kinase
MGLSKKLLKEIKTSRDDLKKGRFFTGNLKDILKPRSKSQDKKLKTLIILRGNSGSGKSTIAKAIHLNFHDKKIALVEQDYFRRKILREKGSQNGSHTKLIENNVKFLLREGYDVILEGIFNFKLYKKMLSSLARYNKKTFFFYFDISLEETLRRSKNKSDYKDFGPEKVKAWYVEKDLTKFKNEFTISEKLSEKQILKFICETSNL